MPQEKTTCSDVACETFGHTPGEPCPPECRDTTTKGDPEAAPAPRCFTSADAMLPAQADVNTCCGEYASCGDDCGSLQDTTTNLAERRARDHRCDGWCDAYDARIRADERARIERIIEDPHDDFYLEPWQRRALLAAIRGGDDA